MPKKKMMIGRNVEIDEKWVFENIFDNIDGSLEGGFFDDLEDFGSIPGDPFVELPHVVDIDKNFPLPLFGEISTSESPSPNSVLELELPKTYITRKRRSSKRRNRCSPWPGVPQPIISSTSKKTKHKKEKKLSNLSNNKEIISAKKCMHCEITETPQWRAGPMGPKTLCNACGVRYRSGRLFPEYRPVASPTFVPCFHSNSHRKVLEMRNKSIHAREADMADDVDGRAMSASIDYGCATSVPPNLFL